jgi:hypothetical protein
MVTPLQRVIERVIVRRRARRKPVARSAGAAPARARYDSKATTGKPVDIDMRRD